MEDTWRGVEESVMVTPCRVYEGTGQSSFWGSLSCISATNSPARTFTAQPPHTDAHSQYYHPGV